MPYPGYEACGEWRLEKATQLFTRHFEIGCETLAFGWPTGPVIGTSFAGPAPPIIPAVNHEWSTSTGMSGRLQLEQVADSHRNKWLRSTRICTGYELPRQGAALTAGLLARPVALSTDNAVDFEEGRLHAEYLIVPGDTLDELESDASLRGIQFLAQLSRACNHSLSVPGRIGEENLASDGTTIMCLGNADLPKHRLIASSLQPKLGRVRLLPFDFPAEKSATGLPNNCTGIGKAPSHIDCIRQIQLNATAKFGEGIHDLSNRGAAAVVGTGLGQTSTDSGRIFNEQAGISFGLNSISEFQHGDDTAGSGDPELHGMRRLEINPSPPSQAGENSAGPEAVAALEVACDSPPLTLSASDDVQLSCQASGATSENPIYRWAWTARGGTVDTEYLSATDISSPAFLTPDFMPSRSDNAFTYQYTATVSVDGEGSASAEVDVTVLANDGRIDLFCLDSPAIVYENTPDIEIGCQYISIYPIRTVPPESFNWEWSARTPTTSVDNLSDSSIRLPTFYVPESVDEDTDYLYTTTVSYPGWNGDQGSFTVTVRNREDYKELLVAPTELTVDEGDTAGDTYGVSLTSQPTADVTVTVSGQAGTDVQVAPASLTFATENWAAEKTVTVTAGHDDDTDNDNVTLSNTASGGGYDGAAAVDVDVTVVDDDEDEKELVVAPTELTVEEGDTSGGSFSVRLASEPAADVAVAVSGHAGTDLTLSGTSLTFTADNWETDQSVTVTAGEDDNAVNEEVTLDLSASGGGYNGVSEEVAVTVEDNDEAALAVSPTQLDIDEGDATGESFNVRLASEPSADVAVAVSGHAGTDLRLSSTSLTFTADNWETDQSVTVTAGEDDNAVNEEVTLDLSASGGGYSGVSEEVAVTVEDNDEAALAVSPTQLVIDEGDATGESFNVRLASEPSADVAVAVSGHAGTDVTLSKTSLRFTADNWETDQSVTVTAGEDDNAVNEEVTLDLSASGGGYSGVSEEVAVIVEDNDEAALAVSPTQLVIDEGDATGESFNVRLASEPSADVAVAVSGHAGTDVTLSSASVTFTADNWDADQPVTVTAGEDNNTVDEEVTLDLAASGGGYDGVSAEVTVRVIDNDESYLVRIADAEASENAGEMAFRVTLSGQSVSDVTVNYATSDGSAEAGSDYGHSTGTLRIPAGSSSDEIRVPVFDDAEDEDNETFTVRLSSPIGASLEDAVATGTILDDDGVASLSVADAAVLESANSVRLRVTLSPASDETVTVRYATSDGTATAGEDYVVAEDVLTFLAGDTEEYIGIDILNDLVIEGAETFRVTLSEPADAELARAVAEVTIEDDDLPVVSVADVSVLESDARAVFTVRLDAASTQPVRVQYATVDGTATAGEDYLPSSYVLVIEAGTRSGIVEVTVIDDELTEPDETFILTLSSATGAALGDAVAEATIRDDDTYRLSVNDIAVGEADGEAVFAITLDQANPVQIVAVDYATESGTATSGADFTAQNGRLEFNPGAVRRTVSVPILDDALQEGSEVFSLVLGRAQYADIADGEGNATIIDDDVVNIRIEDARAAENAGQMTFTVRLDAASQAVVRTAYETRAASATEGVDYVHVADRLEFAPGETLKTLSVPMLDDSQDEPDETFVIVLSGAENASYAQPEATGTIVDDDGAPVLSVQSEVRVSEGAGSASFAASLSAPSAFEITASYATRDGTATAGSDYVARSGTLRIAPGDVTDIISVPILEDELAEGEETFTLTLSGAQNASLGTSEGKGTIVDNESALTVSLNDVTVNEDAGHAVFTARLSGRSSAAVRVACATSDGTATAGLDYTPVSDTLQFDPGELEQEFVVPILQDVLDEGDETFLVELKWADNAGIADASGTGTIVDDDEPVTVSIYDERAVENVGTLHLPVRLSRSSSRVVSVRFESADMTAEAGSDYTAIHGIVVFEQGSTEGVIAVALTDDASAEEEELFQVTLSQPTNATIARGLGVGTIVDDDGLPLLRVGDVTATEDAGEAIFTVRLSVPSADLVTVVYRTVDGTAEAGVDYEARVGTATLAPGEVEKEVRVRLLRDSRDWRAETFSLALESATNAMLEDAVALATILEEESVEEGVLDAYLARFARTASSHLVEAMQERLRGTQAGCASVTGRGMEMARFTNPNWDPSVGEMLSGCGLEADAGALEIWGRGAFTRLSGRQGALSLDADFTTAALGADHSWQSGLMAGMILSHSRGAGTYAAFEAKGEADLSFTGVYPYASYRMRSNDIWVLAGAGRGAAEVAGMESGFGSSIAATGVAGTLASGRKVRLVYEADAFLSHAMAEERERVRASRVRAGVESSVLLTGTVSPYLEAGLRRDAGDAETGMGLEMGGGLRLAKFGGRLRLEAGSRALVMHADEDLAEWGISATLRYGDPSGLGPTTEVRPVWGPADLGGMQSLWRHGSVSDATDPSDWTEAHRIAVRLRDAVE